MTAAVHHHPVNRNHGLRDRIQSLIHVIGHGLHEREETISVALLAALCGQNTFLYGPPGTAKSLISRRLACAFDQPIYFECLMNRFSTPEEVFGPVSIKALKDDRYVRKTEAYLPKAEFAFLDEIWKSSPAILNTLLTLINEKLFRNGDTTEPARLKALIAASNETPEINQGLEALYDRFIVRLLVGPIVTTRNFEQLLNSKPSSVAVDVPDGLRIQHDEWESWAQEIHNVTLSPETLSIVGLIRAKLQEDATSPKLYVSDRRWQRAALLMKASAFFNEREQTNHSDALLLQHCLWTHEDNRLAVAQIVEDAVQTTGIASGIDLAPLDREKSSLDDEIRKELYHSDDIYLTAEIEGEPFFEFDISKTWLANTSGLKKILIPRSKMGTDEKFPPQDERGNMQKLYANCNFHGGGTCKVTHPHDPGYYNPILLTPKLEHKKGDKKANVNPRLISDLTKSVNDIQGKLVTALDEVQMRFKTLENQLASPFVPIAKTNLTIDAISKQIESLKLRIEDCKRLESLCA